MVDRWLLASALLSGCGEPELWDHADPAELQALIARADGIVVTEENQEGSPRLYASTDARDLAALGFALQFYSPIEERICFCIGAPVVHLYQGSDEIGRITNHHADSVRWLESEAGLVLQAPQRWLAWFDARGMPGPREEFEDAADSARQNAVDEARWIGAMPASLLSRVSACVQPNGDWGDIKPVRQAIEDQFPDVDDRARALFAWYGSGAGPWSGYPAYEGLAETLLLELPPHVLLSVAAEEDLSDEQLEGVARLFASSQLSRDDPRFHDRLTADMRQRLLGHVLGTDDADKLARARAAFGSD